MSEAALSVPMPTPAARSAKAPLRTREGLLLVRITSLANTVAEKLESSRLRLTLVVIFSLVFWAMLFIIFRDGFYFLYRHRLISGYLVELLFGLFFASLLVMLIFSTGIILYAGLFASDEAKFLLVLPIPADLVFAFKFQEAMFFSCWGFLLLGTPMMAAYGITVGAPISFYAFAVAFFLSFAFVPGCVGALICLFITQCMPRRKREMLIALLAIAVAVGGVFGVRLWQASLHDNLDRAWLTQLVEHLRVSNLPFLPSHWMSKGLLAAADINDWSTAAFYMLVLVSNGMFFYLVTAFAYRLFYRRAYNRTHSNNFSGRRRASETLPRIISTIFAPLSGPIRVLILKDVRSFIRDPLQWLQVTLFIGLLGFYFITLGQMNYYTNSPYWRTLVGFFNVAVTGLILATFTSRFIFPLLSLEGQKFWILGLCPIERDAILWGKFAFSAGGSLFVTTLLTILSALMLKLEAYLFALHLLTIVILCSGISGIAVGLGARFPQMRETDPSKIAAGFGGTLNLVASLAFLVTVIVVMAIPCHLYSVTEVVEQGRATLDLLENNNQSREVITLVQFRLLLGLSIVLSIVIGAFATLYPMRLGIRAFRSMEF